MTKKTPDAPAAKVELYEKLVATNPQVKRKGAANPYTSCNGHMFSFITKEGRVAIRLPADEREAFLRKYRTKLCVHYGVVMKEYVEVPDALLRKTRGLARTFDFSYSYVSSLKPKPTTRPKKKVTKKTVRKKAGKKTTRKAGARSKNKP